MNIQPFTSKLAQPKEETTVCKPSPWIKPGAAFSSLSAHSLHTSQQKTRLHVKLRSERASEQQLLRLWHSCTVKEVFLLVISGKNKRHRRHCRLHYSTVFTMATGRGLSAIHKFLPTCSHVLPSIPAVCKEQKQHQAVRATPQLAQV